MEPAQVRALVEAAVAAALQNQNVIQAIRPPQAVRPVIPFAVTPAGTGNDAWDFTSGTGLKIFMAATAPFHIIYDGKELNLRDFLRRVWHRAEAFGWTDILFVTDASGTARNITKEHGCLTIELVKAHALVYLRQANRRHQASACLRQLLIGSITSKLADRLTNKKESYTINAAPAAQIGQPAPAPIPTEDGTCMLFEIIKLVSVETKATVALISKRLANLEVVMEECKSNIDVFNDVVDDLISQLEARDVTVPDMLNPLFDGYSNCADANFVKYIATKRDAYYDGTLVITHSALMVSALEKYKIMKDMKLWLKKSDEELELITLKAELTKLKTAPKTAPTARSGGDGKGKSQKQKMDDKHAWKLVSPKEGEAQQKTVNGKKYIYCPYHQTTKWVLEINNKGVVHRTGCEKMKEALIAAKAAKENPAAPEQEAAAAAMANAIEDVGTDTLLPIVDDEEL
ncbi:unknown protein [Seminavis robusta]|uniref:Uncharacterized protein n=1 Tax=Seminavis robusta TaxID=568900 RepID=A0A9N8DFF6_9STRA|nr:unknown protein [Seminavis robusta]|eukprot:Sro115_g056770.1 n/a (459) ;mRNA; f:52370-53746